MRLKRFMDLALVLGSSPFWLPVIALSALAVWVESPGAPVFFTQTRTGKGGKLYSMYKFRSMVPNVGPIDINVNTDAASALFNKIGPAILVTHSHSGGMPI